MAGNAEDETMKDISSQLPQELRMNNTSVGDVTMNDVTRDSTKQGPSAQSNSSYAMQATNDTSMADNTIMGDLTMGEVVASTPKCRQKSTARPSGNLVQGKDVTMADGTSLRDATMGDITGGSPKARIAEKNEPVTGGHNLRNDVSRMEAIAATLRPRPLPVIPPASTVETTPIEGPRLAVFDYFGSTMVDFIVGPQGRKISIHANILLANPDCACFRETLQRQKNGHGAKKLRLMDHPDVVGLMTQFLYTGKVPFIPRRLLQKHCAPAARHPITMLSHTIVKNDSVRLENVTLAAVSPEQFQMGSWSKNTSAEEERLRDYDNYELQMSQKSAAATAPTADNAEGRSQTVRYWRECVQPHLQNVERTPVFGMSILRVEAELYQLKLVQLMLFADKYNMAWLFHDTLASYCKGEALFQRDRPVERHVELAYRCATFRLLPELMAEYGRFCAWRRDSDIDIMFRGYLSDFIADVKLKKTEGNPIPPIIGRFLRVQI